MTESRGGRRGPGHGPGLARPELVLLVAWTVVAALSYLFRIDAHSLWLDEVMSRDAAAGSWAERWRFFQSLPEQHPLYYVLLGGWMRLGESEFVLRSFSTLWAVAGGWVLYFLARRLFGRRVAALSLVLLALSPFWLFYAQEARMYSLLGFLALAAHLAFLRWRETGDRRRLGIYVVVGILGVYTHLFFVFVPASHLAYALWERRGDVRKLRGEVMATGSIYAAYVPWIWVILANMPEGQTWKGMRHLLFALPYTLFRFSVGYSEVVPTRGWKDDVGALLAENGLLILAVTVTFGSALALGCWAARKGGRAGSFALFGLLGPVVGMLLLSIVTVVVSERYLAVTFPLVVLLWALAIDHVLFRSRGKAVAAGALMVLLVLFFSGRSLTRYHTEGTYGKEQWREAAQTVAADARPEDVIVFHANYVNAPFDYYYERTTGPDLVPFERAATHAEDEPSPDHAVLSYAAQDVRTDESWGAGEHQLHDRKPHRPGRIWIIVSHEPRNSRCLEAVRAPGVSGPLELASHHSFRMGAGVDVLLFQNAGKDAPARPAPLASMLAPCMK